MKILSEVIFIHLKNAHHCMITKILSGGHRAGASTQVEFKRPLEGKGT